MLIVYKLKSGQTTIIDTEQRATADPFKIEMTKNHSSFATRYDIRLDLLHEEGLRIDIFWWNCVIDNQTKASSVHRVGAVAELGLEKGRVWRILDKDELKDVEELNIDKGRIVYQRHFGELVDMGKFWSTQNQFQKEDIAEDLATQVVATHQALHEKFPMAEDEEIAAMYGFTKSAWWQAQSAYDKAQADFEDKLNQEDEDE